MPHWIGERSPAGVERRREGTFELALSGTQHRAIEALLDAGAQVAADPGADVGAAEGRQAADQVALQRDGRRLQDLHADFRRRHCAVGAARPHRRA